MNAERLLSLYDRVADAPDAVARLHRFVLDLAVRGKLVEQDPAEEPASELLKRIEAEKAYLVKSGEIKLRKLKSRPRQYPVEFVKPSGWKLTDLGSVALKITDGVHKTPTYVDKGVPFVSVKDFSTGRLDLRNTRFIPPTEHEVLYKRCDPRRGDILICRIGTLGKAVIVDTDVEFSLFVSVGLIRFDHANIDPAFFRIVLNSPFVEAEFDRIKIGGGTHTYKLNLGDLHTVALPLPPFGEQHRIVAKVDELMAFCDRLEEARTTREETRDRLIKASYARLNASDVDAPIFRANARFAIDALPQLTTRADQVKHLRQSILKLAVRGKLVEQDPTDEPASKMLKRVEKLRLPARYAKRSPELVSGDCGLSINRPELPVPHGWLWVPLVQVARIESGHTPSRSRPDWWDGDVPWMGLVDARVHNNGRIFDTIQHTNEAGLANSAARLLPEGTVCFSRTASVGYVVILGRSMATSQDFVNWVPTEALSSEWLQLVMIAERSAVPRFSKGAVHQTIYYPAWLSMHVVLPPLAEQGRIVAKVDELMVLCDRLETKLGAVDIGSHCLLVALLRDALENEGAHLG